MDAHTLLKHHFINNLSLLNVSVLKGQSSGSTLQQQVKQNVLPYVKFSWESSEGCVTVRCSLSRNLRLLCVRFIGRKDYNCDVRRKVGRATSTCRNSTRQYDTYWEAICFQTHVLHFLYFVHRAFLYILVNKTKLVHNFFLVFLSISTCFGQLWTHHQEKQLCFCDIWYLLFCVDDCLVCTVECIPPCIQTVARNM
jgi:hypothetical protein